jgi:hypothetical protein
MDTHQTPVRRRHRSFGDLHLLLISIAIGFCISFGGSLTLAELISRGPNEPVRAELVGPPGLTRHLTCQSWRLAQRLGQPPEALGVRGQ